MGWTVAGPTARGQSPFSRDRAALYPLRKTPGSSGVFSLASLEINAAKSVSPELVVQANAHDVIRAPSVHLVLPNRGKQIKYARNGCLHCAVAIPCLGFSLSLLIELFSLIGSVGNCSGSNCSTVVSCCSYRPYGQIIAKFPVKFPVSRDSGTETGSHPTASATKYIRAFFTFRSSEKV
jgi:hypothetical protein